MIKFKKVTVLFPLEFLLKKITAIEPDTPVRDIHLGRRLDDSFEPIVMTTEGSCSTSYISNFSIFIVSYPAFDTGTELREFGRFVTRFIIRDDF